MPLGEAFDRVLGAAAVGAEWAWRELYRETAPAVAGFVRARGATDPDDAVARSSARSCAGSIPSRATSGPSVRGCSRSRGTI